jgi:hypothetical protein
MRIKYKNLRNQPSFAEVCGPGKKPRPKAKLKTFTEKRIAGFGKPKRKIVVEANVKEVLTLIKPRYAEVFTELIEVVRKHPNLAFEDIASHVFRNLKARDKTVHYPASAVVIAYKLAKAKGAIKTE